MKFTLIVLTSLIFQFASANDLEVPTPVDDPVATSPQQKHSSHKGKHASKHEKSKAKHNKKHAGHSLKKKKHSKKDL